MNVNNRRLTENINLDRIKRNRSTWFNTPSIDENGCIFDYRLMIYVFCDEDKIFCGSDALLRYTAVAFYQDRYNVHGEDRIRELFSGGTSLMQPIIEMLKNTNGLALLTQARIPKDFFMEGEDICTSDIPKMALPDYWWSISMTLTIAFLFPILVKRRWTYKTVDVYSDPKSLTDTHRIKISEVLQQRLKRHVKELRKKMLQEKKFNIRRVREIRKPKAGSQYNKFQMGVWLADRIVRKYDDFAKVDNTGVIEFRDITDHCLSTFSKHVTHTKNSEGNGRIE